MPTPKIDPTSRGIISAGLVIAVTGTIVRILGHGYSNNCFPGGFCLPNWAIAATAVTFSLVCVVSCIAVSRWIARRQNAHLQGGSDG